MAHLVVLSLSILGFQLLAMLALGAGLGFWSLGLGRTLWLGYLSAGAGLVFLVRVQGGADAR